MEELIHNSSFDTKVSHVAANLSKFYIEYDCSINYQFINLFFFQKLP